MVFQFEHVMLDQEPGKRKMGSEPVAIRGIEEKFCKVAERVVWLWLEQSVLE